jgi:hypothetical protein
MFQRVELKFVAAVIKVHQCSSSNLQQQSGRYTSSCPMTKQSETALAVQLVQKTLKKKTCAKDNRTNINGIRNVR